MCCLQRVCCLQLTAGISPAHSRASGNEFAAALTLLMRFPLFRSQCGDIVQVILWRIRGYPGVVLEAFKRCKLRVPVSWYAPFTLTYHKSRDGEASTESSGADVDSCVICMCELEEGETVIRLPCTFSCSLLHVNVAFKVFRFMFVAGGHQNHKSCSEQWFHAHRSCPVCRKEVATADQQDAITNQ